MQCKAAMQWDVMGWDAMQCNAMQRNATRCDSKLCNDGMRGGKAMQRRVSTIEFQSRYYIWLESHNGD
jgi:hypothetical protein